MFENTQLAMSILRKKSASRRKHSSECANVGVKMHDALRCKNLRAKTHHGYHIWRVSHPFKKKTRQGGP